MNKNSLALGLLSFSMLASVSLYTSQSTFAAPLNSDSIAAAKKQTNQTVKKTQTTPAKVKTVSDLPAIKLDSNASVKLTDVNILRQDEESILTYSLVFSNKGNKNLKLIDYWSKVRSSNGTSYTSSLSTVDKDKKTVAPGASTTLTYVVKVGKNTKITDLAFDVVKWDFSMPDYENKLGQFKIPATYAISTPADRARTVLINDLTLRTRVGQINVYPAQEYNYVSIGLTVQNISKKLLEDPKVKFVLQTDDGSSYPLILEPSSVGYKIQPQDSKVLQLMTSVPQGVSLKKLNLQIVQDDETTKKSIPLGTMQLSQAKSEALAVDPKKDKLISIGDQKIAVQLQGSLFNQSHGDNDLSMQLLIRNAGTQSVTLPKYEFALHTQTGLSFPIDNKVIENIKLKPKETKVINLSASFPSESGEESLALYMNIPSDPEQKDYKFSYPVGVFNVKNTTSMVNNQGTEQMIETDKGTLGITLDSLQRLPWSDSDLLTARFKIRNLSDKTMYLPELSGQFKVDSALLGSETKMISTQSVPLLGYGKETEVYVVGKIPTDIKFAQLQVALLEKIGENSNSNWIQFTNLGRLEEIKKIEKGSPFTMGSTGKKKDVTPKRTLVYSGANSDIVYSELIVENVEKHQIDMPILTGFFETGNGQKIKAQVIQSDQLLLGSGDKKLVTLWAKVSKSASASDMRLILGESVTENKLTPPKGEATGYINATTVELDPSSYKAKPNIKDVEVFPYTFSINSLEAHLNKTSTLRVELNYQLLQDTTFETGEFQHKLIMVIQDSSGKKFEKELSLGNDLKPGNHPITFTFDDRVFEERGGGSFQVSLYDEFQGERINLANQPFNYNINKLVDMLPSE